MISLAFSRPDYAVSVCLRGLNLLLLLLLLSECDSADGWDDVQTAEACRTQDTPNPSYQPYCHTREPTDCRDRRGHVGIK